MTNQPTEVVVIGAGYAGLLATVRLARKLRGQPVTITLVNATDVFVERLLLALSQIAPPTAGCSTSFYRRWAWATWPDCSNCWLRM